jgi:hypothetical protein
MTAPTNTVTTLNTVGNREDLEDVIYRVAPEKTPFISNIGKPDKASATYHEWQVESLDAVSTTNAQYEGDDVSAFDVGNQPTRVGNTCQIFRKTVVVSRTQEKVKSAGRGSDLNRQKVLKGIAMRRDMEATFLGNLASNKVENPGVTPRKSGGALAWLTSNTSIGVGASNGGFSAGNVTAATNGTLRNFAEAQVKAVMAACFSNGGAPNQAYMGPTSKQEFSAFTGIAQLRHETGAKPAAIIGAADVYVSDFGELSLIPHPYALTRDCLIADPDYWGVASIDGVKGEPLAKTGDSEKWMMISEATLVCKNEKASGVVRDIQ